MRVMRRASQLVLVSLMAAACSSPTSQAPAPVMPGAATGPTDVARTTGTNLGALQPVQPAVFQPAAAAPAVANPILDKAVSSHRGKAAARPPATTNAQIAAVRWKRVISDNFNKGGVPSHYFRYNGPYGSGPRNCASPSNVYVKQGWLRLRMQYRSSGNCGAGWYTGGVMVTDPKGGVDQRVTLRFRVVRNGAASHYIIPMRWPTKESWPAAGEEDLCETDSTSSCHSFLHYSSSNQQVYRKHTFNMKNWHTVRFTRVNHTVYVYIDDLSKPKWVYNGSESTLPSTFKRLVLQQECNASGCPSGKSGAEEIQITYLKLDTAY